jgi:hypothetical protein
MSKKAPEKKPDPKAVKVETAPEAEEVKDVPQTGHGKFEYIN